MSTQPESPTEILDQPSCEELVILDGGDPQEIVDDYMLEEYAGAKAMSERASARTLAGATVEITGAGYLGPDKHQSIIEATNKLVGATVKGGIAEDVMTIKGCKRCIESGACPLKNRLTQHEAIGARAKTALEKLHEQAVRVKYLHGMARTYGQWSAAVKRIANTPRADQLSDLQLANSSHQKFKDTLLALQSPVQRDQIIKGIYGFIPDQEQQSFGKFINGVAAELYVYEALEKSTEELPMRIRLADATEDIRSGTDMFVTITDGGPGEGRKIPIDAKSPGAFYNLVESGSIRQLDRQGYFGIKENQQGQEVLVINPEGLDSDQAETIPGTNCQSFKNPRHPHDKFAMATYRIIQRHMMPKVPSGRTFSAS